MSIIYKQFVEIFPSQRKMINCSFELYNMSRSSTIWVGLHKLYVHYYTNMCDAISRYKTHVCKISTSNTKCTDTNRSGWSVYKLYVGRNIQYKLYVRRSIQYTTNTTIEIILYRATLAKTLPEFIHK